MSEIKNIIYTKNNLGFIELFLGFINHVLPLKLKFQNETFVALNKNQFLGSITLDKDSMSDTRFKITKLTLEENSTSTAHELVNYVVTRYSAMGARSFYVVVEKSQIDMLNIFKNELNFRFCALEYLFKIQNLNSDTTIILKPFKVSFLNQICSFYNENINSFNRFLFGRIEKQFLNNCKKYILHNDNESKILGYFELASKNKVDYYINFVIDFGYNMYLIDAIKFIYSRLKRKHKYFNLYIKIKDYFMNSKELLSILEQNNIELVAKSEVLAKDYYKEIKENNLFKNPKIIFNDPTIA